MDNRSKKTDSEQIKRFKEAARELDRFKAAAREIGADTSDDALDKVMGKLDLTKKPVSESIGKGEKPRK